MMFQKLGMLSLLFKTVSRILSGHDLGSNKMVAKPYIRLAKVLLPDHIVYRGHKIWLDSPNSLGLSVYGCYSEEYELTLFEHEINSDSVVLDVGANIGLYTLVAAKHAKRVYAFEPDPINFMNLERNIAANNYKNVHITNKAVSDKSERAYLSSHTKYPLDRGNLHLVTTPQKRNQEHVPVDTVSLDEFFADKPKQIDIVKVDIEGLEFEALKGMTNLLNTNKTMRLFLEFNPFALKRHGTNLSLFLDYLYKLCPHYYYIDENSRTKTAVTKEWLEEFAKDQKEGMHINLLGLRGLG